MVSEAESIRFVIIRGIYRIGGKLQIFFAFLIAHILLYQPLPLKTYFNFDLCLHFGFLLSGPLLAKPHFTPKK